MQTEPVQRTHLFQGEQIRDILQSNYATEPSIWTFSTLETIK